MKKIAGFSLSIIIIFVVIFLLNKQGENKVLNQDPSPSARGQDTTTTINTTNETEKETVLYPIKQDGKYGYIDRSGQLIIKPNFEEAQEYKESRALIKKMGNTGLLM
ncbi:WG repeat-containing protein [Paenibacillus sp. A3]|uniref:WG repeat-containing protein n=1 Tax=Paenibacillus sp. A3 TaxID=1337054 RepID=UPI00192CEF4A|nr:WG repeat-containing protein [Paenibacillus sp. A3]